MELSPTGPIVPHPPTNVMLVVSWCGRESVKEEESFFACGLHKGQCPWRERIFGRKSTGFTSCDDPWHHGLYPWPPAVCGSTDQRLQLNTASRCPPLAI